MLQLRVFGTPPTVAAVADSLQQIPGSRHVIQLGNGALGDTLVSADLVDDAVDRALEQLARLGVPVEDVVRLESIGPSVAQRPLASVVWSDLLSQAGANAGLGLSCASRPASDRSTTGCPRTSTPSRAPA